MFARVGGGNLNSDDGKWLPVIDIVSKATNLYTFQDDLALARIEVAHQQVIRGASAMPLRDSEWLVASNFVIPHENSLDLPQSNLWIRRKQ